MVSNLRRDDSEALFKILQRNSIDLNDFLLERRGSRSKEEFDFLKKIAGRLMGAQYFEVIEIINEKYKDILENSYGSLPDLKFEFPDPKK